MGSLRDGVLIGVYNFRDPWGVCPCSEFSKFGNLGDRAEDRRRGSPQLLATGGEP